MLKINRLAFASMTLLSMLGLGVLALRWRPNITQEQPKLPLAKVEVVLSVPTKMPKSGVAWRNAPLMRTGMIDFQGWPKIRPTYVSQSGQIHLVNAQKEILSFAADGKLRRRASYPWLHQIAHLQSSSDAFWVIDFLPHRVNDVVGDAWRLIRIDKTSDAPWQIGKSQSYAAAHRGGKWAATWERSPSSWPPYNDFSNPTNQTADHFKRIYGLYTSNNGDVFILTEDAFMQRFNSKGKLLERYLLKQRGSRKEDFKKYWDAFSAVVTSDGTIYCHPFGIPGPLGITSQLPVDKWTSATQCTTRVIDVSALGAIPPHGIRLMDVDSKGNLYFQYVVSDAPVGSTDPKAIGMAGLDGKAKIIFDIQAHYEKEIEQARARWGKSWGGIGVGDLLRVSDKGELYLEIATDKEYRIDKVSLRTSPNSPPTPTSTTPIRPKNAP